MTQENYERVLRAFFNIRPFRPFTLELVNGSRLDVNHPEVLRQHGDLIIYKSTMGMQSVFECASVVRFIEATGIG
jgi:hypothetical protein